MNPLPNKYGTEDETTENEFSEIDKGKASTSAEVRSRFKKDSKKEEKKSEDDKKNLRFQKPAMVRNVPFLIKYENFLIRTLWTIVMLAVFLLVVGLGHAYLSIFIFLVNIGMVNYFDFKKTFEGIFNEIINLKRNREKDTQVPFFFLTNWYFFAVGVFFFYGKLFSSKLTKFTLTNRYIYFMINYHNFISFLLWILGFLLFVMALKKGFYRYQFRQFAWTHLAIFLVVAQCATIMINLYEGIIWFILPCLLVITNDTFAYIFGFFFGKTKLIELSPKKTWEGFIGGLISTLIASIIGAHYLSNFQYLICPKEEISFIPFEFAGCEASLIFSKNEYIIPNFISNYIGINSIFLSTFQLHAMVLSMFASLISPFGGFFASGFKRAIKIKDFADIIPGHGGITDRMDCQILMGMFSYLYLHNVILNSFSASLIISYIINLSNEDQMAIYKELHNIIVKNSMLKNETLI